MKYRELINQIKSGRIDPVYFIHGEEKFLIEEAISRLKGVILKPEVWDFNYHLLDGAKTQPSEIIHLCQTLPVLCDRRLVLVRAVEGLPQPEALEDYLKHPSDRTCLVLIAGKLDQRKRIFSMLKARTTDVEVGPLSDSQLTQWIQDAADHLGIRLLPEAVRYLSDSVGNDLFLIHSELEKIALIHPGAHALEPRDLETLLTGTCSHSVFEWLDAMRRRDLERALRILQALLDSGEYPLALLGLLAGHFRRSLRYPPATGSGRRTGSRHSGPGDDSQIVRGLELCLKADSRLKGSQQSPQLILEELVWDWCATTKNRGLGTQGGRGSGSRAGRWLGPIR